MYLRRALEISVRIQYETVLLNSVAEV